MKKLALGIAIGLIAILLSGGLCFADIGSGAISPIVQSSTGGSDERKGG